MSKPKIIYSVLTSALAIYSTNAQAIGWPSFSGLFSKVGNTPATNTQKILLDNLDDSKSSNSNNDSTGSVSANISVEDSDTDDFSERNFYTLSTLNLIYGMLANDKALPTVSKYVVNKNPIYTITEKSSKSDKIH